LFVRDCVRIAIKKHIKAAGGEILAELVYGNGDRGIRFRLPEGRVNGTPVETVDDATASEDE